MLWMCDYTMSDSTVVKAFGNSRNPAVGYTFVHLALDGVCTVGQSSPKTSNWIAALPKGVL